MNVIPFPMMVRARRSATEGIPYSGPGEYEFTEKELVGAVPLVLGNEICLSRHRRCDDRQPSAELLCRRPVQFGGGAPNCLVAKHEVGGDTRFFWSTEGDPPQIINDLADITDAHIRAIRPPRNEKGWLDPIGWMGVYATRMIATAVQVV